MGITAVNTLDNQTLDIQLDNESQILLNIGPLLHSNPNWACLAAQPLLPRPETDGHRIFWAQGPSLTLDEILALLEADPAQ